MALFEETPEGQGDLLARLPSNFSFADDFNELDLDLNGSEMSYKFDPNVLLFRAVVHSLDLYFVPVVAAVGILGNSLSFVVFNFTYLNRMSSSVYLAGLAISDTVFLLIVLISWSTNINIQLYHTPGCCQILVYIAYVSSFLSVWYVVSFTVERHVAIRFPLSRQTICTARRAKIVVISLAVAAAILYTFALWTSGVAELFHQPFCTILPQYFSTVAAINNVDTVITLIVPTILIIGSNARIAFRLSQFYKSKARVNTAMSQTYGSRYSNSHGLFSDSSYNRLQMKVTRMLLIVSTVFLLCNIPSHAVRVYVYFMSLVDKTYRPSHAFLLVQKIFQFVYYLTFAVNFILYNVAGKTFRRALARLSQCIKQRAMKYFLRMSSHLLCTPIKSRRSPNELIVQLRGTVDDYN